MAECTEKNAQYVVESTGIKAHRLTKYTIDREDTQALKYWSLYLQSYQKASDLSEAKESAIKAAIGVVRNPIESFIEGIDVVELDAVKQLQKDQKNGKLFELLLIFSRKALDDYLQFYEANPEVFSTYGT